MLKGDKPKLMHGFTIVELLVVIVVIGVLASIVIVAYNGVTGQAREAKISSDLRAIKQAITRLEIDIGDTVFGCTGGGTVYGPEGAVQTANSGLVSVPTAGAVNETCTWSSSAVSRWKGPYVPTAVDPWNRSYYIDLDYYICDNGIGRLTASVLSRGQNGAVNYPTSANSGACTTTASDDTYLELWRS